MKNKIVNVNNRILVVIPIFLVLMQYGYAQYSWVPQADLPASGRHHASVFTIGNFIYLLCGTNTFETEEYKDVWRFDISTNIWKQMKDFPGQARSYAAAFAINGKGYIGVGVNRFGIFTDFWEYDPASDTWTQKADFMGEGRAHPAFFVLNNEGYVGCGDGDSGDYKDFWKYTPSSDTWTRVADFMGPKNHHPAFFTINNKAYVCTGHDRAGHVVLRTNYEYDPVSNSWTQKASLPGLGRVGAIGFAINDKGFIGGGFDEVGTGDYYKDFYAYDPDTDTWSVAPDFPDEHGNFAGITTIAGNVAYAGTGMNDQNISNSYWFAFKFESASSVGQMNENEGSVRCYPNPVSADLFIEWNASTTMEIRNQLGQTMYSGMKSQQRIHIDTREWADGMYMCTYSDGRRIKTCKIMVIH